MKRQYLKPIAEKLDFDYMESVVASDTEDTDTGNGDVGQGRGRGGGCDGESYHRNQRSFSNGNNSGC